MIGIWRHLALAALAVLCVTGPARGDSRPADVVPPAASLATPLDAALAPTEAERQLVADASDGVLHEHSLLEAALVAGGVSDPHRLAAYRRRLAGLAAQLRATSEPDANDRDRAAAILRLLHQRVLTGGYVEVCSDVAVALDEGRYNCVSSAVLFTCVAGEVGLQARVVECPGHAYSEVFSPAGDFDVETTCPEWFDERDSQAAGTDRFAGLRQCDPGRAVEGAGVAAILFYNRGVDQLEAHDYPAAVAANWLALQCDPANAAAGTNLLAAINNWALAEAATGDADGAVAILRAGQRISPAHELFRANLRVIEPHVGKSR